MDPGQQPGDFILNRYMPDAPADVREEARRRLYGYVRVLLRIATRLEREKREATDSSELAGRRKMEP